MAELYNRVAGLRNVAAFLALVDRVEARDPSLPGMACFYGRSGRGKSTAAAFVARKRDCVVIEVRSLWRTKRFLQGCAEAMGLRPAKVTADILDQVAERLARTGRTLIIDEADHMARQGQMIEVARDLHESTQVGVILVGEETLPQTLQRWERVHGRMLDWVGAEPGTAEDLDKLLAVYAPDLAVAEDLRAAMLAAAGPSIRRMCVNIQMVRARAQGLGRSEMALAQMGRVAFPEGEAPEPRVDA